MSWGSFSLWERVMWVTTSLNGVVQQTVCIALHWEKCGGCVLWLLLWQWNGSSCFVLQQKAEISRIWINKIHATILIILVLFCLFSVLLKSMGGTIPPAPANASTQETSKVRYEEFITENWCWLNYWATGGENLLSVFTQMLEVNVRVQFEACPLCVADDLLQMAS